MEASGSNVSSDRFNASVKLASFFSTEPCVHEQATAPWDNNITPLARGQYGQEVTSLAGPRLILYRESTRSRVRVQGLSPPDIFSFAVPLVTGTDTRWWGKAHHENGLPVTMPGGVHTEFSAGQQHLIALLDLKLLRECIPEDLLDAIAMAAQNHVLPTSQESISRLGAELNSMLNDIHANPQMLQHAAAVDAIEQDLLAAFRQHVDRSPPIPKRVGRAVRQRGLQRAFQYIGAAAEAPVSVSELCTAANVSQRTLEYGFRETFGISPLRFLQLRKFHKTRRDLLAADGRKTTVLDIAYANGFYQMGRFAVRYKALFNESPSITLMRPPPVLQSRLGSIGQINGLL
jgi:AraC-like DNA-binding protein